MSEGVDMLERVQRTTALARRLYLHVKHGGAITESDMERLVRGMEEAASTPKAARRMVEVVGCSRPHWGISDCSECGLRAEFQANSCAASAPKTAAVSEHQTENPRKPS